MIHPGSKRLFLNFPAYDYMEQQFGLHHETALTACMIVAFNCPGYLSLYPERDAPRIPLSQILLTPGGYYYHLDDNSTTGDFYNICLDFRTWRFPNKLPLSWIAPLRPYESIRPESDWTSKCAQVKFRDVTCLVSGFRDSLTIAHLVPREEEEWLDDNGMDHFLCYTRPINEMPANLFCLRADLHEGFNLGEFAIVPKSGQLVVHFLQTGFENVKSYHNNIFNHNGYVNPEMLYARFAWALFKTLKASGFKVNRFKNPRTGKVNEDPTLGSGKEERDEEEDRKGKNTKKKRKRKRESEDGGVTRGGRDEGTSGTKRCVQPSSGDKNCDTLSLQHNDWSSDIVLRMALGEGQSSLEADIDNIERDLKKAAHRSNYM